MHSHRAFLPCPAAQHLGTVWSAPVKAWCIVCGGPSTHYSVWELSRVGCVVLRDEFMARGKRLFVNCERCSVGAGNFIFAQSDLLVRVHDTQVSASLSSRLRHSKLKGTLRQCVFVSVCRCDVCEYRPKQRVFCDQSTHYSTPVFVSWWLVPCVNDERDNIFRRVVPCF